MPTPSAYWSEEDSARTLKTFHKTVLLNPYINHRPTVKQATFLLCPVREVLYGGAGGGGKSEALLMGALQYVHQSGYAALLLRRTYAELALPGGLMDRAAEWLTSTDAHWDGNDKRWTFPSGASLSFGYLQTAQDRYRYQSSEFQYIGFDELTEFEELPYRFLFSRLRRRVGLDVPLRMRAATNPGGTGHVWVKDRFLQNPEDRVFIPARLSDNPHTDGRQYVLSLAHLDPVTRAQILDGDWEAREGGMFRRHWFQVVQQAPAQLRKVRAWDLAGTEQKAGADPDWTVGALLGRCCDNYAWILDMRRVRETPGKVEALVKQTAALDGPTVTVSLEQEPGQSGKAQIDHYRRHVLPGVVVKSSPATGSKAVRAAPLSSAAEAGNVRIVSAPFNRPLLDEMETFPGGNHDDQIDAVAQAYGRLFAGPWSYDATASPPDDLLTNRLPEGVFL